MYNGNIGATFATLPALGMEQWMENSLLKGYHYDQLNRITQMRTVRQLIGDEDSFVNNNFISAVAMDDDYATDYHYDANGNIDSLVRKGNNYNGGALPMDNMGYRYPKDLSDNRRTQNRLRHVKEWQTATTNYTTDFEQIISGFTQGTSTSSDTYQYDKQGNLIKDRNEEIENIEWYTSGKIHRITRTSGSTQPDLEFHYSPSGHRTAKIVKPKTTSGALKAAHHWEITHYSRDAQGQVIATYRETFNSGDCSGEFVSTTQVQEHALYGSQRLGIARSTATTTRQFTAQATTQGFSGLTELPCGVLQNGRTYEMNSGSQPITLDRTDATYTLTALGADVTLTGNITVTDGSLQSNGDSHTLKDGHTVSFTAGTHENDLSLDFPGRLQITSTGSNLSVNGGAPLTYWEVPPAQPRAVQRLLEQKDYELTDYLGNVLATISDRKTGITDSVESTVFSEDFTDGVDAWQFREAGSIQASEGYMYVYTEGEGHYAYRSVSINTGSGCNYSICLDLTETEIEEGLSLVVHDGESALYTLSLTPNAQNCFENLTLPENFQLQLHASVAGSYYVDNISITKKCVEFKYYVAHVTSAKDYYPFGSLMPGRQFNSGDYRYGYGSHEMDNEVSGTGNHLSFGDYGYNSRLGRRWNVDPQDHQMPGISPYSYALGNPIMLKDPDGELPIIPFLLKASAAAGADVLLQASMIYLTDDNVESFGDALTKVDKTDVALSFVEGLNPFKVPGGKFGEAALVGFADVLVGIGERAVDGEENTGEAIGQDFLIGFASQLTGDQATKLLSNKAARRKLRNLLGNKFDALFPTTFSQEQIGDVISSSRALKGKANRGFSKLQQRVGDTEEFAGIKATQENAEGLIGDILGSKNKSTFVDNQGRLIVTDKNTGRGIRFQDDAGKTFDTFVGQSRSPKK